MSASKNFNHYQYRAFLFKYPIFIRLIHLWNWIILLRNWHLRTRVNQLLSGVSAKKVMDLGSGDGQYLFYVARNFSQHSLRGIDRSAQNVQFCNHHLGEAICQQLDLDHEELPTGQDVVFLIAVLQYIVHPQKVLNSIADSLKPNGKLLIYVPINGKVVLPFYNQLRDQFDHYEKAQDRKRVYTEELLYNQLESSGLTITHQEYCIGSLGILSNELYNLVLALFSWHNNIIYQVLIMYLVLHPLIPLLLLLNALDRLIPKSTGNGLLVEVERKE